MRTFAARLATLLALAALIGCLLLVAGAFSWGVTAVGALLLGGAAFYGVARLLNRELGTQSQSSATSIEEAVGHELGISSPPLRSRTPTSTSRGTLDYKESDRQDKWTRAERIAQWILVAAGTLGIAGLAIVSVNQSDAKNHATANAAELRRELTEANRTIGSLRSANDKLQSDLSAADARIRDLEEQLRSAGVEIPEATPSVTPQRIRHSGLIELAENGDSIDLNAPATDPTWGATRNNGSDRARFHQGQLEIVGAESLTLDGRMADYATCSTGAGYTRGPTESAFFDPASLTGNQCIRLQSGRYATIKLVEAADERATFSITVWENK